MADVVYGTVTEVIDGDTFKVSVYFQSSSNTTKYGSNETIRIADIDAPEIPSAAGLRAKSHLENRLKGKSVRLEIQARDTYGRLVCKVRLA
jgi:endonuclease YncB( thermonuclease family)